MRLICLGVEIGTQDGARARLQLRQLARNALAHRNLGARLRGDVAPVLSGRLRNRHRLDERRRRAGLGVGERLPRFDPARLGARHRFNRGVDVRL